MLNHVDKVNHFASMFSVSIIALFAFPNIRAKWIFVGMIILSGTIEMAQFTGNRTPDLLDFTFSCLGVLFIAIAHYSYHFRNP